MKILILSFYYYPDLCAGSFRCTALVKELRRVLEAKYEIEVITTLPNRYSTFQVSALEIEQQDGLTIRRIPLPLHYSGMFRQAKAFLHFARQVTKITKANDYILVVATSSRLMTAVLGTWVAQRKTAKLYLDIRDIFVNTIGDLFPKKFAKLGKFVFSLLEKWSFRKAQRINLVSAGFASYFHKRYPEIKLSWFSNGIDPEFICQQDDVEQQPLYSQQFDFPTGANERDESLCINYMTEGESVCHNAEKSNVSNINSNVIKPRPLMVVYAGNIGEGQGLHNIIPKLARQLEETVQFKIIGGGARRDLLAQELIKYDCKNVDLLAPLPRLQLVAEYQKADILFLHLNNHEAFTHVLPSKLFEYAAMQKPIWAGVAGYAADFIKNEVTNAVIFAPCDIGGAVQVLHQLELADTPRKEFINKYNRVNIMQLMTRDILLLI